MKDVRIISVCNSVWGSSSGDSDDGGSCSVRGARVGEKTTVVRRCVQCIVAQLTTKSSKKVLTQPQQCDIIKTDRRDREVNNMMNIRQYLDTIFHKEGYEAWEQEDEYMWSLMEQDIDQEIETGVEGHAFEDYCASKGVDTQAPHNGLPGTVLQYWCMDHYE